MDELEINTDFLAGDIRAMEEQLNQTNRLLHEIYAEVEEMNAMWEGPANQAFCRAFHKDQDRFSQITKGMQEYLQQLQAAGRAYEACEHAASKTVASIRI